MNINEMYQYFLNRKQDQVFLIGSVASIKPLTITLIPSDTSLTCVYTQHLKGLKVGSRLLLTKFQNRFIALGIIDSPNVIQDCIMVNRSSTQTVTDTNVTAVQFDTQKVLVGSRLSLNSYAVKIGTGVKTIEVTSELWVESTSGSYSVIYIIKNSTTIAYNIFPEPYNQRWRPQCINALIPVTTDDMIYTAVAWQSSHASENIIGGGYPNSCNMTVKVVELDL